MTLGSLASRKCLVFVEAFVFWSPGLYGTADALVFLQNIYFDGLFYSHQLFNKLLLAKLSPREPRDIFKLSCLIFINYTEKAPNSIRFIIHMCKSKH